MDERVGELPMKTRAVAAALSLLESQEPGQRDPATMSPQELARELVALMRRHGRKDADIIALASEVLGCLQDDWRERPEGGAKWN